MKFKKKVTGDDLLLLIIVQEVSWRRLEHRSEIAYMKVLKLKANSGDSKRWLEILST